MQAKVVTVIVITYNSSEFVLETLESIRRQTYSNLELIVSDDCSTDNTVSVVEEWVGKNVARFSKVRVVTSGVNTGIAPNVNRGILAASGEYIKLIAGDDILVNECIERMLAFCTNRNLEFAYSRVTTFADTEENESTNRSKVVFEELNHEIFYLTQEKQYRRVLSGFRMYAPGLFMRKDFITRMGLFDEKFRMMEDYPFILKVSSEGHKLELLDEILVKYRVRSEQESRRMQYTRRKSVHTSDLERFEKEELIPRMKKEKMYIALYNTYVRRLERRILNSSDKAFVQFCGKLIGYLSVSKIIGRARMIWFRLTFIPSSNRHSEKT